MNLRWWKVFSLFFVFVCIKPVFLGFCFCKNLLHRNCFRSILRIDLVWAEMRFNNTVIHMMASGSKQTTTTTTTTIYVINYANEAEAVSWNICMVARCTAWSLQRYHMLLTCTQRYSADRYETYKYYIGMLISTICHYLCLTMPSKMHTEFSRYRFDDSQYQSERWRLWFSEQFKNGENDEEEIINCKEWQRTRGSERKTAGQSFRK